MFEFFKAHGELREINATNTLFQQGDPIRRMYWLVSGKTRLVRRTMDGQEIVLQSISSGFLAEASLYHETYHCDGEVLVSGFAYQITKSKFEIALSKEPDLHKQFSQYLANNLRYTRALLELRSLKRISDRLDGWIALKGAETLEHGSLTFVASEMGVSRAALYRELSNRRKKTQI